MESIMNDPAISGWLGSHVTIRTDGYVILAALLSRPPTEKVTEILRNLTWDDAVPLSLENCLRDLSSAGETYEPAALEEEFNRLFGGLGSVALVPSASWYRERKIQAMPLAALRTDLIALGIVRQPESCDYEDYAGPLCEVMALISEDPEAVPLHIQATFFQQHIASWMMRFFRDLESARNADFYRVVGRFGACFLECERQFLEEQRRTNGKDGKVFGKTFQTKGREDGKKI
jgi:TorA maturation chaperone TorD